MKLFSISLSVVILQFINCAIIPERFQGESEFHRCLVVYINQLNISTELKVDTNPKDVESCEQIQKSVTETIDHIYIEMSKNLQEAFTNRSESDCVMDIFNHHKFFEINIVLTAAQMTAPTINDNPLREVYDKSKDIFVLAAISCFMSDDISTGIIEDLSKKVKVSEDELKCIKKELIGKDLLSEELPDANSINVDETTIAMTTFEDVTEHVTILPTTEDVIQGFERDENEILEDSYEDIPPSTEKPEMQETASVTEETEKPEPQVEEKLAAEDSTESHDKGLRFKRQNEIGKFQSDEESEEIELTCEHLMQNVNDKIKLFEFSTLNHEENLCMSQLLTAGNFTMIHELIVFQKTPKLEDREKEIFLELIIGSIWNLIECTDIFGFKEFGDNMLTPLHSNIK